MGRERVSAVGSPALPFNNAWGHVWLSQLWRLGAVLLACSREQMTGGAGGLLLITLQCSGRSPQQRIIQPKMPIVPRLRNTGVG